MNDNNRKEDIMSFEEFREKRKNPIITTGDPNIWLIYEVAAYKVYKCKTKIKNKFISILDKTIIR